MVSIRGLSPGQTPPFETKWMAAGSLHNWFANTGSEIEEGRIKNQQQHGLRWPAYYNYQDIQAAKAFWIGTTDFTDADGSFYPYKVIHVGPRVEGRDEFFPIKFSQYIKFPSQPEVYVDGNLSLGTEMAIDSVDGSMDADVMILNIVNTPLGITMTRKIMQFSQQYHDNYILCDYTFTNTGNTDYDDEIERPGQTLTGVYFYYHFRFAVNDDTRFVIGNATGWGINSMLDVRGDGVKDDPDDAVDVPGVYTSPHMRIQYMWHGRYPPFTAYDNIGGPIWSPYFDPADTVGRLGAAQFAGVVTLHCDTSPADPTDDVGQPSTTSYEGSDEPFTSQNSQFDAAKMAGEYTQWMQRGHRAPRHADVVEPSGNFTAPTGDPSLGTPGGFSNANGYGPFTLGPGESVRLVWAEGVGGLSREKQISVGRRYKNGEITALQKNDSVFTSRDSLFQTFRRALANYHSGYTIPRPPLPPKSFNVASAGDKIGLTWDVYGPEPNLKGFRIYRAVGRPDNVNYEMVYEAGPTERSWDDINVTRGVAHYYYILAVGDESANDGTGLTPLGELVSNRIWTQTYDPAFLKRAPGDGTPEGAERLDKIRIVPNPYHIGADPDNLLFPQEQDKIAFFNVPGECTIRIYTELGELVEEIVHTDGSGDAYWNSITSSRQVVVSGIYIVVIDNTKTGERVIKKLSIIR